MGGVGISTVLVEGTWEAMPQPPTTKHHHCGEFNGSGDGWFREISNSGSC